MSHPSMWVDRGGTLLEWKDYGITKPEDLFKLVGKTCEFKGFTSCSISSQGKFNGDVYRHIYVPQEAYGGYLDGNSEYEHEHEFLLDKNTRTRIVRVEIGKNGEVYTVEEVIV